jgi:hypothetical protein
MNFISRIIKSINAMRERLKIERHEAMYGPHFNEECALKAVSKMENEDGSRGEHWSLEETTSIANQYGINLKGEKYNKYDWYVADIRKMIEDTKKMFMGGFPKPPMPPMPNLPAPMK